MALVSASLAADLKTIFDFMDKNETTTTWLADQIAAAIDKQIKTATVQGTATGVQSGPSAATITGSLT